MIVIIRLPDGLGQGNHNLGAVTVEVTNGKLGDATAITRVLTIRVQVGPETPVLRCPTDVIPVTRGGKGVSRDITSLCSVWSPTKDMADKLTFEGAWQTPVDGVSIKNGRALVIDASGDNLNAQRAAGHLEAGARRVLLAAPSDDADLTIIYGVNEGAFDPARHRLISTGPDTPNALAPPVRVLEAPLGLGKGEMTAVSTINTDSVISRATSPTRRRAARSSG